LNGIINLAILSLVFEKNLTPNGRHKRIPTIVKEILTGKEK
jgi:hypothetical protein